MIAFFFYIKNHRVNSGCFKKPITIPQIIDRKGQLWLDGRWRQPSDCD